MVDIPEEYASALDVAERALDYTYNINSNYLGHSADEREGDFRSALEFLSAGFEAVACIPSYFPGERLRNVLRALRREIDGVSNRLRCFEVVRG